MFKSPSGVVAGADADFFRSLGPPPYNRRATYGSMDVNSTNLDCSTSRVGIQTCSVKAGTTLNMPIWGTS